MVEHNRLDILSLAALAGWMGQMVADPLGITPDGEIGRASCRERV